MRPTSRGVVVGIAALVLLVAGLWFGYPMVRAAAGCAVAAVGLALLPGLRGLRPRITRTVSPERVERGTAAVAQLDVANPTHRRQPAFVAHDAVGDDRHEISVRSLPAGGTARFYYELPTARRGVVPVGPLAVERTDLFSLASIRRTVGEQATLRVHPRRHAVRLTTAGRPRHHHEGEAFAVPMRGSMDLRGLRPYVVGDEVRHLHWKASARTGQLMLREYVDPAQPFTVVLLDTRTGVLTPDAFEEAVEVAASVLWQSCEQDLPARLCTTGGLRVPVGGGARGAQRVLDLLCELTQDDREDAQLHEVAGPRGEGWLVVVGGADRAGAAPLAGRFADATAFDVSSEASGLAHDGLLTVRGADAAAVIGAWNGVAAR